MIFSHHWAQSIEDLFIKPVLIMIVKHFYHNIVMSAVKLILQKNDQNIPFGLSFFFNFHIISGTVSEPSNS